MTVSDEAIVLNSKRWVAVFALLVSVAFFAVGVFMIVKGRDDAWIVVGVSAIATLRSIYGLRPDAYKLTLDRNGVEMKTMFKPIILKWSDVEEFYLARRRNRRIIAIRFTPLYKAALSPGRQLAAAMTGLDGVLPNHSDRSEEALCELLNDARRKWARPDPSLRSG
jgi:hypothetical protein